MLSHQEISDRFEIQDLLARYCEVIDSRDWDAMDDIFTPDAEIDFTQAGGIKGSLLEIKAYLDRALKQFPGFQHMIGLPVIKVDGDTATSRVILFNPMIAKTGDTQQVFFVGLWYCDKLIRTADGWRITYRNEEVSYFHNLPADFQAAD
ncbi:MAG: nuclear transport factor 2 family protein [Maricaulaceae bacterium]